VHRIVTESCEIISSESSEVLGITAGGIKQDLGTTFVSSEKLLRTTTVTENSVDVPITACISTCHCAPVQSSCL